MSVGSVVSFLFFSFLFLFFSPLSAPPHPAPCAAHHRLPSLVPISTLSLAASCFTACAKLLESSVGCAAGQPAAAMVPRHLSPDAACPLSARLLQSLDVGRLKQTLDFVVTLLAVHPTQQHFRAVLSALAPRLCAVGLHFAWPAGCTQMLPPARRPARRRRHGHGDCSAPGSAPPL